MRALRLEALGQAPVLREISAPTLRADEVLVSIRACGLNFADLLMIEGKYQEKAAPPFTMGMEVAGIIEELGTAVSAPLLGQRVAVFGGIGGLAESGAFPANRCVVIPDEMSFEEAAAFQIAYGTSHMALAHKAQLKPGETLLVLGAAGGVGLTAVEIGKRMGARVIASARGPERMELARRAGADHVLDSDAPGLRDRLRELGGVDVVYDPVGGAAFGEALRATKPDGRMLVIGFAGGEVQPIPANHLLVKNISVIGFYWGGYLSFAPEVLTGSLTTLLGWYREGGLRPHVSNVLPLSRAEEALELLRSRRATGKVVVVP